jgi:A/G-specific adenine glycosylase
LRTPTRRQVQRIRQELLIWFEKCGRSFPWRQKSATIFQQVTAELLLQRTRAEVVATMLPTFWRAVPSWHELGRTSLRQIENLLKPLGLWRRRAVSLRKLALRASVMRGRFPKSRDKLELLPGIGQYMASAILVINNVQAAAFLDVNMARVLERMFGRRELADIRYDPELQRIALLVVDGPDCKRLNWSILDLGSLVCTVRNPRCRSCPVLFACAYGLKASKLDL